MALKSNLRDKFHLMIALDSRGEKERTLKWQYPTLRLFIQALSVESLWRAVYGI